jgi:hypothetical protein
MAGERSFPRTPPGRAHDPLLLQVALTKPSVSSMSLRRLFCINCGREHRHLAFGEKAI